MEFISVRIKNSLEVWEDIAKTLDGVVVNKQGWSGYDPNKLMSVIQSWQQTVLKPDQPYDFETLESTINEIDASLSSIWQIDFEKPTIEVVDNEHYLPRLNSLVQRLNTLTGTDDEFRSPPGMMSEPYHGVIVIPRQFPLTNRQRPEDVTETSDVQLLPWAEAYFKTTLFEEICHAYFRQARGEWKEGYVNTFNVLGKRKMIQISNINEAIAMIAKENTLPYALDIAAEKLKMVFLDRQHAITYLQIDALVRNKGLRKAAMVDDIANIGNYSVEVTLRSNHPYHEQKMTVFNS